MTVYHAKDRKGPDGAKKAYRYDFVYLGQRYISPRSFPTEREARDAEAEMRRRLRRIAAGLEVETDHRSPAIADWAEVYLSYLKRRGQVSDLLSIEHVLRVVLRFWGRRPARELKPHEAGPYHDLRLRDPVDHATHLLAFEDWMHKRGVSGATKNHYRTAMSRLYAVAQLPEYREITGVTMNPFRAMLRDRTVGRTVTLTLAQLRAILAVSSTHLRLAIAIASLAPKLRLANVLGLRWTDIAADWSSLTVARHKTVGITGLPLVAPISEQLRLILEDAKNRRPKGMTWVVHYRGGPIRSIVTGLKDACAAAGVPYGFPDGATFHTIRHTAATLLASLGVAEGLRKDVMGHLSIATTQRYTHLEPVHQRAPLELLSGALPLSDLVVGTPAGARAKRAMAAPVATAVRGRRKPPSSRA